MRAMRILVVVWLAAVGGCGLLPDKIDETKGWSAQRLYSEAHGNLSEGDYEKAIDLFEKLQARYPFGHFAQQAQLEMAYAYYKFDEPESAIATLDRFAKNYPRHPNLDYAYYLRGLTNFNRGLNIIERFLPTDQSRRDPGAARQSFDDFAELLRRFPDSKYADDARQRMVYLRNNLALYEVHVAEYYMRREAYVAAAKRAKYVVEYYQGSPAVPEALAVMAKAYKLMGVDDLSADALSVLEHNYPNHPAIAEIRELQVR
jgi:outer membrane protein assembly factor BamD